MNANMKVSEQCRIAASKGNQVLGMIHRNITYKEKSLIVSLYKAIVRPHLEYCIQAWSPYLRKDIDRCFGGKILTGSLDKLSAQFRNISRLRRRDKYYFWHLYNS